jgi:hypothetical protein
LLIAALESDVCATRDSGFSIEEITLRHAWSHV